MADRADNWPFHSSLGSLVLSSASTARWNFVASGRNKTKPTLWWKATVLVLVIGYRRFVQKALACRRTFIAVFISWDGWISNLLLFSLFYPALSICLKACQGPSSLLWSNSSPRACPKREWTKTPSAGLDFPTIYLRYSLLRLFFPRFRANSSPPTRKVRFTLVPRFFPWLWKTSLGTPVCPLRHGCLEAPVRSSWKVGVSVIKRYAKILLRVDWLRDGIWAGWVDKLHQSLYPLLWSFCLWVVSGDGTKSSSRRNSRGFPRFIFEVGMPTLGLATLHGGLNISSL